MIYSKVKDENQNILCLVWFQWLNFASSGRSNCLFKHFCFILSLLPLFFISWFFIPIRIFFPITQFLFVGSLQLFVRTHLFYFIFIAPFYYFLIFHSDPESFLIHPSNSHLPSIGPKSPAAAGTAAAGWTVPACWRCWRTWGCVGCGDVYGILWSYRLRNRLVGWF